MRPSASTFLFGHQFSRRSQMTLSCVDESVAQSLDVEGFNLAPESLFGP